MKKLDLEKVLLPDTPGVYFFLGAQKNILYIGKATSLRSRVRSYFASDIKEKRSELIETMVREAVTVEVTETDSVLEALILETNLIRTHKPQYNTRSKDDKSYNHLVITKEEFPRILIVRERDLYDIFDKKDLLYTFGPFPSSQLFREAMKIVRKLFKFYDTKTPVGAERSKLERGKINFNRQIGLYPDKDNPEEYLKTIRHIKLFFQGKKGVIIKELSKEMLKKAKEEKFEEAHILKKKIFALQHIQDVALIKQDVSTTSHGFRIEAYDVSHHAGSEMVSVMVVIENGVPNKSEYRKFKIRTVRKSNDTKALLETLERRFSHPEWRLPDCIVVDGGVAQQNVAKDFLIKNNSVIPVIGVVKNKQHKPERLDGNSEILKKYQYEILLANAEAHRFAISYHHNRMTKKQFQ